ncbi:Selenide, water dikinase [bioreactor metagenome]|uniref:Selenide, water dikinase n=1 Tax=bioreactor metagenome TaxID=1076179 RepID=A0A645HQK1_9ZZZZ
MASGSKVNVKITSNAVPLLPDAAEAANMGLVPAGAYANRGYLSLVEFAQAVPENIRDLCFDPQTSGGLLISLPAGPAASLLDALHKAGVNAAAIIGEITSHGKGEIYVY